MSGAGVDVRTSPLVSLEPGVVGGLLWSRPILLLPFEGISERMTPSELESGFSRMSYCHE